MFNKLKQFKEMRSQAKTLQSALADQQVTGEKSGVKMTLNGNMEMVKLELGGTNTGDLEKILPGLFNDTIKKAQRLMAEKIQAMGGMDKFKY
jgi:DNA-binding protein YbaB